MDNFEKTCGNCKWYEDFARVCTNGSSEHCAYFVYEEGVCEEWEG